MDNNTIKQVDIDTYVKFLNETIDNGVTQLNTMKTSQPITPQLEVIINELIGIIEAYKVQSNEFIINYYAKINNLINESKRESSTTTN